MNILVVEDNKPVSLLICRVVEELGHTYVLAADGEGALKRFQQRPIDALIVDVELPGLDGFQLTQQVRGEAVQRLPLLLISGNSGDAYKQQASDAGADQFLPKPLRPAELKATLQRLLG